MLLTHENINQMLRNAMIIKTEDEHLAELASEMVVLMNDCKEKTTVTEDNNGNLNIGNLTF